MKLYQAHITKKNAGSAKLVSNTVDPSRPRALNGMERTPYSDHRLESGCIVIPSNLGAPTTMIPSPDRGQER